MPQRKWPARTASGGITVAGACVAPRPQLFPRVQANPPRRHGRSAILRYPDPRLHTVAKPVAAVDERIRRLVDDMLETMYAAEGVGLAATQVDVHERVVVIDTSETRDQPLVLINPEIVAQRRDGGRRGRLPVGAQIYDKVERHASVKVRALDRDGQALRDRGRRPAAVCVQHEMDHLLGKVFVEYLSPLKRDRIRTKMLKKTRDEQRTARAACAARGLRLRSPSPARRSSRRGPAALLAAGHPVPLVLTQPDRPAGRGLKLQASAVKQVAQARGVPWPSRAACAWTASTRTTPRRAGMRWPQAPDVLVVAAYGLILPAWVLALPRLGCLNIHASLLPRWRGAAPIQRAIEAGDAQTGITIMQMDEGLDTGAMLLVERLPITADDTRRDLARPAGRAGRALIVQGDAGWAQGRLAARAQPADGVTYARKIDKAEARSTGPCQLRRSSAACGPSTPSRLPRSTWAATPLKLWRARVADAPAVTGECLAAAGRVPGDGGLRAVHGARAAGSAAHLAASARRHRPGWRRAAEPPSSRGPGRR
jgi:methionyl-tRNA formyltransferase